MTQCGDQQVLKASDGQVKVFLKNGQEAECNVETCVFMIKSEGLPEISEITDAYDKEGGFYKIVINGTNFKQKENGTSPIFTSDNGKIVHTPLSSSDTYLEYRVEGVSAS